MEEWCAYIDESDNTKSFCVGGFLARESTWDEVAGKWSERIAYENRRSAKKGLHPIARYHSNPDGANLKRDFSEKNGWSIDRQIALTKRICEIIGQHPMGGIVGGRRYCRCCAGHTPWMMRQTISCIAPVLRCFF